MVYFQENMGEVLFNKEYLKWAEKNPMQAVEMAVEIWKELGIYEELRGEINPETIQRKFMAKWGKLTASEKEKMNKKA